MAITPQTEITNTDENHRSVQFTVPAAEVEKAFSKNVNEFRKQVSMKGFKPGQVPRQLFVSRFGDEVYQDTVQKIVDGDLKAEFEKLIDKWSADENLEMAAPAEHGELKFEQGADLVYTLKIAFNKPLTVQGYKDLGISVSAIVVAEGEIDDVIAGVRKRFAKDILVERASKLGDVVKGTYLNQVIDGVQKELPDDPDFELEVSDEITLSELKDALIGVSANEEKNFSIHYPEDHPNAEFKGKTADYKVRINGVYEMELPPQDEEFYKLIGAKDEADFKEKVSDDILRDKKQKARHNALKEAFDKLIAENPFPVLEEQIEYTAKRSLQHHHNQHNHDHDHEEEDIAISKDQLDALRPEVIRVLQEDRILRSIIEQESLKPTQGQVDARVEEIAENARMDFAAVKDMMRKNGQINNIREALKLELAKNLLIGETLPERAIPAPETTAPTAEA